MSISIDIDDVISSFSLYLKLFKNIQDLQHPDFTSEKRKSSLAAFAIGKRASMTVSQILGSNPVEALNFYFSLLFPNCINWRAHGEDLVVACFSPPRKIISFILSSVSQMSARNLGRQADRQILRKLGY